MKKEILLGGLAVAGVAAAGYLAFAPERASGPVLPREEAPAAASAEDRQKIEELAWEEWEDAGRYAFCLGQASIQSGYDDPLLRGHGRLEHTSKELLLFDKEANKLFILTREIVYGYDGRLNTQLGDLAIDVPVSESGKLSEAYARREMPIRIDYANGYVATNPDTKAKAWVYHAIGEESEMVEPRTGCAGIFSLDNAPGKDLLVGSENIAIDRACAERDVSGNYEGDFSFVCSGVDHGAARNLFLEVKAKEALQNDRAGLPAEEGAGEDDLEAAVRAGEDGAEDSGAQTAGTEESIQAATATGAMSPEDAENVRRALEQIPR